MRQNEKYHPFLEISKVSWLKWAKNSKEDSTFKQYSSLLIELSTPEIANEVVEKDLVKGYQLKTCTRYNRQELYYSASNIVNTDILALDVSIQ